MMAEKPKIHAGQAAVDTFAEIERFVNEAADEMGDLIDTMAQANVVIRREIRSDLSHACDDIRNQLVSELNRRIGYVAAGLAAAAAIIVAVLI